MSNASASALPLINIDGNLSDWKEANRIDRGDVTGYSVYGRAQGDSFVFAIHAPLAIGANTTAWLNTDRDATTGYKIFGFAGGAEYNVNFLADGTVNLYKGGVGETLVKSGLTAAFSADHMTVEFKVDKADIGHPQAIDTLYDVNDSVFLPGSYSATPYTVFDAPTLPTDQPTRVAILYSESTANNYFDKTAYSQLFMAAQNQAMQAGVPFDVISEKDLTDVAKLAQYKAIVFPSFRNVEASLVTKIANTLEQVTKQYGVSLISGGEFMTNDEKGAALPGDSYARMKLLFDATRVGGGTGKSIDFIANDANHDVLKNFADGELVRHYANVGWNAFASLSGSGKVVATQIVDGVTYNAVQTGGPDGHNILFSTPAKMSDSNVLWQAIDHSVHGSGISVGLHMTRERSIVASRTDMDQSQFKDEVKPEDGSAGIYDRLLPILDAWKAKYGFVGSYYVNVGNDAANGMATDWSVSYKYFAHLLAAGNEIGTHSYTHPENTNLLTTEQIAFEFGQSKAEIEKQMSAYLGRPFTIDGAAVPGAPEKLPTSTEILKYVSYLTGGYSGVGAGYPNAMGFLTPAQADKPYIAPNTSFDFTLVEFQKHTPAEAAAIWDQEWQALTAKGQTPIVVWPWHDYGPTTWSLDQGVASPYTKEMFETWIARAAASGAEFVTVADLAHRIQAFSKANVTSTVSGDVITATVSGSGIGTFTLDVGGQGAKVVKNVGNWYAFDDNSVFLPSAGGSYTITLGAKADDVTHITALPMRAELLSVSGDGSNLSFSAQGEGKVVVDLRAEGTDWVSVTGATVASKQGELATLDLGAIGRHDVKISYSANVAPVIDSNGGGARVALKILENQTAVTTLHASDANAGAGDSFVYKILGGADAALFSIDAKTGAVAFRAAPDYETPLDAGKDNVYDVIVGAVDSRGAQGSQALAITVGDVKGITLTGKGTNDVLTGTNEQDTITGLGGKDVLNGLAGDDILNGGTGADTMTGGAGRDTFVFTSTLDSGITASTRDVITDFVHGVDRIDVSAIDANIYTKGDQAFTFLATAGQAITGPAQLNYHYETVKGVEYTVIAGNTGLVTLPEFQIALQGHHVLTASDFVL
ncbi:hypothetical protein GCM10011390_06360 [Aureimonas endophytica]|uniref:Cadherin domain-containing protein n=1 Tax=Aureimonas endophytica TaxID=2027858 RepID=A0A916ZDN6_9HYPH|nr:cadherin domain-containing protein [Aureimonas endophytica]GGD90307.1 hypothetical protein GCM10011390_06360 [Aureimonas endophytica]